LIQHALAGIASTRFRECLNAAATGLSADANLRMARYAQSAADFYQPYFLDKAYIFENYLVNQVLTRLFPFARDNYLNLYRELVGNLALIEVLLVGMAAQYQGLSEERVLQLLQTFARHSNHNHGYLAQLLAALQLQPGDSFVSIMWLLKAG
jgi:lysine-N-methylase